MISKQEKQARFCLSGRVFCRSIAFCVLLPVLLCKAGLAMENESPDYFKLLSTIEYSGEGQFNSQAETFFTVHRRHLSDNKVEYNISGNNIAWSAEEQSTTQNSEPIELSFVVDRNSRLLSGAGKNLKLLEIVNNKCVKELNKVTMENIDQTWEQTFNLSYLGEWLPGELQFTLTAIQLDTEVFGEMIAVRALSEPFVVRIADAEGVMGDVESKINAVYLFDPAIEKVYMSISVFEATTKINGSKEKLRHEIATYKTDSEGSALELDGLGKSFGKFVRKVGLTRKPIKIKQETELPDWAKSEGLRAAQIANLCAATACEGALNPVAAVFMPAAQAVQMQSYGTLLTTGQLGTVSTMLATGVPAIGSMKIAAAPAFMGMSVGTAGAVAGGTIGTVAVAGGSSSSSDRSASSP